MSVPQYTYVYIMSYVKYASIVVEGFGFGVQALEVGLGFRMQVVLVWFGFGETGCGSGFRLLDSGCGSRFRFFGMKIVEVSFGFGKHSAISVLRSDCKSEYQFWVADFL